MKDTGGEPKKAGAPSKPPGGRSKFSSPAYTVTAIVAGTLGLFVTGLAVSLAPARTPPTEILYVITLVGTVLLTFGITAATLGEKPETQPSKERLRPRLIDWLAGVIQENKGTLIWVVVLAFLAILCYSYSTASYKLLDETAERIFSETGIRRGKGPTNSQRLATVGILQGFQHRAALRELAFHLSVAMGVAIIVVLVVEIFSRKRMQAEAQAYNKLIADSVYSALFSRMVPPLICAELDDILKIDYVKENVRYILTFYRPEGEELGGKIILRRSLTYTIRNLTGLGIPFPLKSEITSEFGDEQVKIESMNVTLPRHVSLSVNNARVTLCEDTGTLKRNAEGQLRILDHPITLTSHGSADVFVCSEEIFETRGSNSYTQNVPALGLTVVIDNKLERTIRVVEVNLNHPKHADLIKSHDGVYAFAGGIVPGQSFTVFWDAIRAVAAAKEV